MTSMLRDAAGIVRSGARSCPEPLVVWKISRYKIVLIP
jgi:hypothetical protein